MSESRGEQQVPFSGEPEMPDREPMRVGCGPHEFRPLRKPRWWHRGEDDRCFHCYLPKAEHPVQGWADARPLNDRSPSRPTGLRESERIVPLTINGVPAAEFVKRAFDLGATLNGKGRYELRDRVQRELRGLRGMIRMAERDALDARKPPVPTPQKDHA